MAEALELCVCVSGRLAEWLCAFSMLVAVREAGTGAQGRAGAQPAFPRVEGIRAD